MIADKRLLALSKIPNKEDRRESLKYIHVKGNKAEATNKEILVQCEFENEEESYPPGTPGISIENKDIFLSQEQIENTFKNVLKKTILPILRKVRISFDPETNESILSCTDLKNVTSNREKIKDINYPDTEQVFPEYEESEIKTIGLSLKVLEKIVNLMKSVKDDIFFQPILIMQIEKCNKGFKFIIKEGFEKGKNAFPFIIKIENKIKYKGLIMPYEITDNDKNEFQKKYTMEKDQSELEESDIK